MNEILFRTVDLDRRGLSEKRRTVPAILSTDKPIVVNRPFGPVKEALRHDAKAIDLTRAKPALPLLFNHNPNTPIGAVENVRINGGQLLGDFRFSRNSKAEEVFQDVKDGLITGVSAGYRVLDEETNGDTTVVTRWKIFEASITPVQADDGAQILRSMQLMKDDKDKGGDVTQLPANNPVLLAEQTRRQDIDALFSPMIDGPGMRDARDACKDDFNCTVDQARQRALDTMGRNSFPAGGDAHRPGEFADTHFSMPERRDEFQQAAVDALCLRSNVRIAKPHPGAQDLVGCSTLEMIRMILGRSGVNTSRMTSNELVKRAMTTSDFPLLLADTTDKSVLTGYNEAAGTHRGWTAETFARDFKLKNFVAAGETPDLALVNEDGEFTHGSLVEDGSSVQLATYGKMLSFSRQAIINDDTGELLRAARSFGASAMRLESDITYGVLVANPVMSDGDTLFHANHNNIGTGGVPSVTTLGEARQLLRKQTGLAGNAFLDLQPFAVVAPPELETVFEQLLSSLFDPFPATGTSDSAARNPFANRLELIVDPRLSADSTTRWYVVTNPNVFQWAVRVHLEGQPNPFVDEQNGWSIDGLEIKVRHDFAALINEYRGIVKNDGV